MSETKAGVPDVLKKIIAVKREEVAALKSKNSEAELRLKAQNAPFPRGFLNALIKASAIASAQIALIAEIKKASPSKGIIREDFDPVWLAQRYAAGGATCLSILTDEQFFQGSIPSMRNARSAVTLPVLRKDFIIDPIQIIESRAVGADAILLIAACLPPQLLWELHEKAASFGMDVLVEFHNEDEFESVMDAANGRKLPLVGINNRNLRTFEVSLQTTARLAHWILAEGSFLVAESGIVTGADVRTVRNAGARAILVGESLMKSDDPGEAARQLLAGIGTMPVGLPNRDGHRGLPDETIRRE